MLDLDALAAIERRLDGLSDAWTPPAARRPRPEAAPRAPAEAARCPYAAAAS
ncbi:hypothetical protein P2H44_02890 [Albimonas sp. CAU 1670]|uniref:hypothetical protein n=1 Tax=Albimonas sp. CAU 1670 TaxID=3032599 RepID=UPI0023DBDCC0|nr:hypothetical protein [Albimonas sp. CAU 1670]MDF2231491.1 hypothetical protein [Albimonas sp. CAU 1670]